MKSFSRKRVLLRIKIWSIFLIIFFGCTKVKNNFPDLLVPSIESKLTIKKLVSEYAQLRGKDIQQYLENSLVNLIFLLHQMGMIPFYYLEIF